MKRMFGISTFCFHFPSNNQLLYRLVSNKLKMEVTGCTLLLSLQFPDVHDKHSGKFYPLYIWKHISKTKLNGLKFVCWILLVTAKWIFWKQLFWVNSLFIIEVYKNKIWEMFTFAFYKCSKSWLKCQHCEKHGLL